MIKFSPHLNVDAHDQDLNVDAHDCDEHSDLTLTSMPTSIPIGDDDDDARRDQQWRCKMQPVRDRQWWIGDDGSTIYKRKGIGERESVRENEGEREEKRISWRERREKKE